MKGIEDSGGIPVMLPLTTDEPVIHRLADNSSLFQILEADTFKLNSYHHQGIKKLSEELEPVATAADGLIETVVMPGKAFILAVQWHPEFSYKHDAYNSKLFSAFIDAC